MLCTASQAFCFEFAAQRYQVNETILKAIAVHESRLIPGMQNRNSNGTEDLGLMGINTVHLLELSKFGVDRERLMDACSNVQAGAWLLQKKIRKWGNTWKAIGAYHSENGSYSELYQERIMSELKRLRTASEKM